MFSLYMRDNHMNILTLVCENFEFTSPTWTLAANAELVRGIASGLEAAARVGEGWEVGEPAELLSWYY